MTSFAERQRQRFDVQLSKDSAKAIDRIEFLREHPHMSEETGTLLGTVMCCNDFEPNILTANLEMAYQHIFGDKEHPSGCEWCKKNFELSKEERLRLMR